VCTAAGSAFRSQGPATVRTMTQVTLTSVLVFGFVMVVLCCIALAVKLVGGPRRRRGSLMSLVIIVVVVWRLSDFLH
jgi:lipopolysaccharide export LptBFGC system permease protein LptF